MTNARLEVRMQHHRQVPEFSVIPTIGAESFA
jgi:hypothetical protein